ncbi:hypothetical protein BAUCODRAFT_21116 [Baudoinia panamericana UAMH 10762]|uniref:Uncharacterized protein n=1 Tax=Baudoinia panamericana (strain UAMH 10762) TaxID=717646 RepID=M2M262_BAUPA|nr:uncharacterized protein BAUCODRAFT_21116 [Baudoinia panamericana UAMH 10762]EMD01183.1 hypothetical protein BAUCODRAFT_21116 [Baudoinia panamericana UAMH 10762]
MPLRKKLSTIWNRINSTAGEGRCTAGTKPAQIVVARSITYLNVAIETSALDLSDIPYGTRGEHTNVLGPPLTSYAPLLQCNGTAPQRATVDTALGQPAIDLTFSKEILTARRDTAISAETGQQSTPPSSDHGRPLTILTIVQELRAQLASEEEADGYPLKTVASRQHAHGRATNEISQAMSREL